MARFTKGGIRPYEGLKNAEGEFCVMKDREGVL